MENVALWHERDISHSSVERIIGPDATVTLDFALRRMAGVIEKLVVYPENMRRNLDRLGGLIHSQRVLLALTQKGVSARGRLRLVQRNAMRVWQRRRRLPGAPQGRPRGDARHYAGELEACSTSATTQARRHDLRPRLRVSVEGEVAREMPGKSRAGVSPSDERAGDLSTGASRRHGIKAQA